MTRSSVLAAAVAWGVLGGPARAAYAQAGSAQSQFDYGLSEMQAGRYATGCPALAESYRLDPHPGVLFTLAECENRWGQVASAVTHYEAYLDLFSHMAADDKARQRGRDRIATAQRARLQPLVPLLAIALPPGAPPATTVTRDGTPLPQPSIGAALPVDPGDHVVVARTPDGAKHEAHVTLGPGQRASLVVDLSPPPAAPAPKPVAPPEVAPPAAASRSTTWLAPAIAGVAGLGVGAAAGVVVLSDKSTVGAQCRPDRSCSQAGLDAVARARTWGVVSDVGFAAGGAASAVALVLLYAASRAPAGEVQPVAVPGPHGAWLGARVAW